MTLTTETPDAARAEPRLNTVQCLDARGLHRMAYWEWGEPTNPHVVVCVHGLTRQGRDFDRLARELSVSHRVVCPDVVGRGRSDWLADPMAYAVPTYVADMVTLLARLDAEQIDWVGTSMGGLIGMMLASLPGAPLRRLVLNDVGPTIEWAALERIRTYVGVPVRWQSLDEAADALWAISQGFGPHTREQWLALTRHQVLQLEASEGGETGFKPHYDPAIAVPFRALTAEQAAAGEALMWQAWARIKADVLLLRGAQSDLLSVQTAQRMTQHGPRTRLLSFEGVGHAPTLVAPDQRAAVVDFLRGP